jgi:hypothetical protein
MWTAPKDYFYAAIKAVDDGLSYANECLAQHDLSLGRTTRKNKTWAETMEADIRHMTQTLAWLRSVNPYSFEKEQEHAEETVPTAARNCTNSHDPDCAVVLNGRHACSCSLSRK